MDPASQLLDLAREEIKRSGFEYVVEHSDRSEAVYIHIKRDRHWYGIRVACHQAVYQCSRDYQQIVLPIESNQRCLEQAADQLTKAIYDGNAIVADPAEIRELIEYTRQRQADGWTTVDSAGVRWRWDGRARNWQLEQPNWSGASPPGFQPRAPLSHLECSSLRHRLNFIAQWSFEERTGATDQK